MKFVLIAIVVVALLAVGIGVRAMRAGDKAPAVGTQAPDFTLNDQNGNAVTLSLLLAAGPVLMSVFRGFW